jgi:DNA oxidative demethylase
VSPGGLPDDLLYVADFVSGEEEAALLAELEQLDFHEIRMRGQTAKRTVRHFGLDYDYERGQVTPTEPLSASFEWLRERTASLVGRQRRSSPRCSSPAIHRAPRSAGTGMHRCSAK